MKFLIFIFLSDRNLGTQEIQDNVQDKVEDNVQDNVQDNIQDNVQDNISCSDVRNFTVD